MKTNKLKNKVKQSDLEFRHDDESTMICNHDGDVLVYIDEKHTGRLDIYYPEQFSLNLYDDIVKYAQTTVDARKDEIEATFFDGEISFAKKFIDHAPNIIEYEPAKGVFQKDVFKFNIYGRDDYEVLLSIMAKASGTEMKP